MELTDQAVGHTFGSGTPKDHPNKIWFHLDQWFPSEIFSFDFFIIKIRFKSYPRVSQI